MSTEVVDARKALVRAIWSCIVDASSMNVVLSGPEANAAMDGYRAAVLRELRKEVAGMEGQCHDYEGLGCDSYPCVVNVSRKEVLAAIDKRLGT
jgi:hypothetical protein